MTNIHYVLYLLTPTYYQENILGHLSDLSLSVFVWRIRGRETNCAVHETPPLTFLANIHAK